MKTESTRVCANGNKRQRLSRLLEAVRRVKSVDNQIVIVGE